MTYPRRPGLEPGPIRCGLSERTQALDIFRKTTAAAYGSRRSPGRRKIDLNRLMRRGSPDLPPPQPLHARQNPTMTPHLLDMKPSSKTGGARPLDVEEALSSVRYYDWIAHFGRRTPGKIAAQRPRQRTPVSYAQFDARISRLAAHLRDKLGVARGERVAVLALNTTDTLEVQFACFRIGAVFLPLNTRLTVPELQFIVGDASPKVMIHDADLAEVALTVAKLCGVSSALLLGRWRFLRGGDRGVKAARSVPRSSRSMTSRPSCTPRARRASPRARSSPMA